MEQLTFLIEERIDQSFLIFQMLNGTIETNVNSNNNNNYTNINNK